MNRKIVLIDDDAAFCKIMETFALSRGVSLDCFPSLGEMGSIGRLGDYSVAVVDYDLGPINGVEVAEYLPIFFANMPMVLISGRHREHSDRRPWPSSIRRFVHKDAGPDAILDAASDFLPPYSGWEAGKVASRGAI